MGGGGGAQDVSLRRYLPEVHAEAVRKFKCRSYGQRYTNAAQEVIREAADAVDDEDCLLIVAVDRAETVVGVIVYACGPDKAVVLSLGVVHHRRRQGIGMRLKPPLPMWPQEQVVGSTLSRRSTGRTWRCER